MEPVPEGETFIASESAEEEPMMDPEPPAPSNQASSRPAAPPKSPLVELAVNSPSRARPISSKKFSPATLKGTNDRIRMQAAEGTKRSRGGKVKSLLSSSSIALVLCSNFHVLRPLLQKTTPVAKRTRSARVVV